MNELLTAYEENYQKLYTLAFRITGTKESSEDVLQESFINAYKAFDKFRKDSSIYTWLYKIVLNNAKKQMIVINKMPVDKYAEEHNISTEEVFNYVNSFGDSEDEIATSNSKETCLQLFMNCMPAKYKVVFTHRSVLHLSVRDTASIMECTESDVKVNLHRARKLFKEKMEDRCSLINKSKPCKCSTWINFAKSMDKPILKEEIRTIKQNEKALYETFHEDINELIPYATLYNTLVMPEDFRLFKDKIQKLIESKQISILNIK